jgi:hypothetical protein
MELPRPQALAEETDLFPDFFQPAIRDHRIDNLKADLFPKHAAIRTSSSKEGRSNPKAARTVTGLRFRLLQDI